MISKFVVLVAFVALAHAGIYEANPWQQPTIIKKIVEAEAPANYQFAYEVNDAVTGDVHSQNEKAENGAIRGSYQLNDADGYVRIVRNF